MRQLNLDATDRKVAIGFGVAAGLLMIGLAITGLWHWLVFRPTTEDIEFFNGEPFLPGRPDTATEIHATLADMSAAVTLLIVAWVSYRVLARVSKVGVAALLVVGLTIIGGGGIMVNKIVETQPAGTYDVDRVPDMVSTALHVASIPVLIAMVLASVWLGAARRAGDPNPSWLDRLGH